MFPAPYPYLLLLVPAAVLARDDFRTRRVDASWLAVLGTVSVGVSWHTLGWRTMLLQTAGNAALLLLSGTALFGYLRLRRLSVRHAFGAGRRPLPACRRTPVRTDGVSEVSDRRLRRRPPLVGLLRPSSSHDPLRRRSRHCAHRLGRPSIPPLMAVTPTHIPTEILRLLTAQEAAEYRLVPFAREAGRIRCYGETGHDYTAAAEELEVLYGWQVEVVPIAADDLQRLLLQHYRPGAQTASAAAGRTAEIGQGRQFLFALVGEALRDNASDIHLEPYEQRCRIRMRIDGKLAERYVVERAQYMPLVNQIKILASLDISEKRLPQDGRIGYDRDGEKFDVRVSTLPTIYGEKVVLRLLTRRVELLELRNLGFSARQYEDYCRAIARPFGMVLICGPTGSGKSTTLYATLRRLNALTDNILTIEDPIEYTLEGVNQVQLKEEIGLTFTAALRTFLRQDPDIIMLGEIRRRGDGRDGRAVVADGTPALLDDPHQHGLGRRSSSVGYGRTPVPGGRYVGNDRRAASRAPALSPLQTPRGGDR